MTSQDPDVQAAFAATLVDEWVRSGVTDAVVAPGSRSTPMLMALADNPGVRVHVVLDERSAGFIALGLGLATGRPAPVVTTSGTASVELHPAMVEAHHAGVAMVAVTTDRPPELHGVGAPQTIEQDKLYAAVSRWEVAPGAPDRAGMATWRSLGSRMVLVATGGRGRPGPVHVNLAFREPLIGDAARGGVPAGRPDGRPWHQGSPIAPVGPAAAVVAHIVRAGGGRGLVVAGAGCGDGAATAELGRALGWPVLADPRSGARLAVPGVIGAADALLRSEVVRAWIPDVVLRLGRPPASKVVGEWLAGLPPTSVQILVDPYGDWVDPDRSAAVVSEADPAELIAVVRDALVGPDTGSSPEGAEPPVASPPSPWWTAWVAAESVAQEALEVASIGPPPVRLGEPGLARRLSAALGTDAVLVTSSSMPVRDVEWFAAPRPPLRVLANRGANGIDGVVSTAIGVALAGKPTVALIGDLAFAYDISALLWAARRPIDCTFIVVDNDGGGIFSFLPQAEAVAPDRFEALWGTPHGVDLLALAGTYGARCSELADMADLDELISTVGFGPQLRVARFASDRSANVADHDRLHAAVATAVAAKVTAATDNARRPHTASSSHTALPDRSPKPASCRRKDR